MAFDPGTITKLIEIGTKLYSLANGLFNGESGDPLQPIIDELIEIRQDIAELGRDLMSALEEATDDIIENQHLEKLVELGTAHAAISAYLRTYPELPDPAVENDGNYRDARNFTQQARDFFERNNDEDEPNPGEPDLFFMPTYVTAMNFRIEFITGLHQSWFDYGDDREDIDFPAEIQRGINRLADYIDAIRAAISQSFRITVTQEVIEQQGLNRPFGTRCAVIIREFRSEVFRDSKFVPLGGDVEAAMSELRNRANEERNRLFQERQTQVLSQYELILERWNGLLQQNTLFYK